MRGTRAFTLVEVLVALTLGSLAVLLAHAIFSSASDYAERMASFGHNEARRANGRRFLAAAIGSMEVGTGPGTSFEGGPHEVEFATSALVFPGAAERRRLGLRVVDDTLVADQGSGTIRLVPMVDSVCFDYLLDVGADARWSAEWRSSVTAPIAMRLRIWRKGQAGDTLLVAVGVRG